MSDLQFFVAAPPVPRGLLGFKRIPVWVMNKDHPLAVKYEHLLSKLRSATTEGDAKPRYTLLSLPDILWMTTHMEEEDFRAMGLFVYSYFYGTLLGSLLKYGGVILSAVPLAVDNQPSDGGYLYVQFIPTATICPTIFGLYGEFPTGLRTTGAWVFRCIPVTRRLCNEQNLESIAPIGRIGTVSRVNVPYDFMRATCDLRLNDYEACWIDVFPEHPIQKHF